jgi:hypothetical protein
MAFGSVTLEPGVNVERTPMLLRSGVSKSNLIRYRDGLIQKMGGWARFYPFNVQGVPRDLHAWEDLNQAKHLEVGTTTQLAVIGPNGVFNNVTPQTLISNFTPNFATVINTPIVTVVDPNISNVTPYDAVFFNVPVSIGGLILDGLYQIQSVVGTHSYTFNAGSNATSTSSTSAIPIFTTISGNSIVSVHFTAHKVSAGDSVVFEIPTTGNGVTIGGVYTVLSVTDADNFTIQVGNQANASSSFSMNGGNAELVYYINLGPLPTGTGYGLGNYGAGNYGFGGSPGTPQTGTPITAVDWTSDNWGEILIACPEGGGIYQWDPTGGFINASVISSAPPFNTGIFISTTQQILIALGSSIREGVGWGQDPLLVQWSDVGNFFQWTASAATQAGNYRLSSGSLIKGGMSVSNQNLIWTDLDLWAMSYIGPPDVYGFNKIGAGMGLASLHAAQALRGSVFWMGPTNFHSYTSNGANVLPCPVWDAVFQNLNTAFIQNVRAMPNTPFNEAGWLYPSLASTGGECDSYVKMNITEPGAPWDYGSLPRSAWIDQTVLGMPIGATPQGLIYQHETSPNADGVPLIPSFTTGFFYLQESEQYVYIDQIIPDFKWSTFPGGTSATIQITFNVVNFPGDTPQVYGPYNVTSATEILSVRFRGRLMSITVSSGDLNSFWRIGSIKFRYGPAGRR